MNVLSLETHTHTLIDNPKNKQLISIQEKMADYLDKTIISIGEGLAEKLGLK